MRSPLDGLGGPAHLVCMDTDSHVTLEPLIDVEALARYLGIHKQTIYDWRVEGRGPRAYRIGRHLRFAVGDVRDWVERQREQPQTDAGRDGGRRS